MRLSPEIILITDEAKKRVEPILREMGAIAEQFVQTDPAIAADMDRNGWTIQMLSWSALLTVLLNEAGVP